MDPKERKELVGQVQKMIHERTMFIPLTSTNSPAVFEPRIKASLYKIRPLIWFPVPLEDMELALLLPMGEQAGGTFLKFSPLFDILLS